MLKPAIEIEKIRIQRYAHKFARELVRIAIAEKENRDIVLRQAASFYLINFGERK